MPVRRRDSCLESLLVPVRIPRVPRRTVVIQSVCSVERQECVPRGPVTSTRRTRDDESCGSRGSLPDPLTDPCDPGPCPRQDLSPFHFSGVEIGRVRVLVPSVSTPVVGWCLCQDGRRPHSPDQRLRRRTVTVTDTMSTPEDAQSVYVPLKVKCVGFPGHTSRRECARVVVSCLDPFPSPLSQFLTLLP